MDTNGCYENDGSIVFFYKNEALTQIWVISFIISCDLVKMALGTCLNTWASHGHTNIL